MSAVLVLRSLELMPSGSPAFLAYLLPNSLLTWAVVKDRGGLCAGWVSESMETCSGMGGGEGD